MPRSLAGWEEELNLPAGALDGWNDIDIVAEVETRVGAQTYLLHDGRRPALPSCVSGAARHPEFSVSLCWQLCRGRAGAVEPAANRARAAAAIGALPTGLASDSMPAQLIERASLTGFEALARAAGQDDPHSFYYGEQDETTLAVFTEWAGHAADSLAFAILSTAAVLDLDAVILAGGLPEDRTAELLGLTTTALSRYNAKGVHLPDLHQAEIGITARAIGSAFLRSTPISRWTVTRC